MKALPLLLLLAAASAASSGCRARDHMLLREPDGEVRVDGPRRSAANPVYHNTSFWEMARAVNAGADRPGTSLLRSGSVVFEGPRYKEAFDFHFERRGREDWSLELLRDGKPAAALRRDRLGLAWQELPEGAFLRTREEEVWRSLEGKGWTGQLRALALYLPVQEIDPGLAWKVEEDGIRSLVISRVSVDRPGDTGLALRAATVRDVKHQYWIDRNKKAVTRIVRNSVLDYVLEDARFSTFRDHGGAHLPCLLSVTQPTGHERLVAQVKSSRFLKVEPPAGVLRPL